MRSVATRATPDREPSRSIGGRRVFTLLDSPVGTLTAVANECGLAAILWENDDPKRVACARAERDDAHPTLRQTRRQLDEYFTRKRTAFSLPLAFAGTDFQKRVWAALLRIPFGETRTYLQIATELGDPKAVRAVGAANGRNPISIVAPCHRVIGASGRLVGFAGGLEAKAFLLDLERGSPRVGQPVACLF